MATDLTPDERQRLLIGLLLVAHDSDERGFRALVSGVPRAGLAVALRSLAEMVVGGHLTIEDPPGSARGRLAQEALHLAAGR